MDDDDNELINAVFATALDPARIQNLIGLWNEKIRDSLTIERALLPVLQRSLTTAFDISERIALRPNVDSTQPQFTLGADGAVLDCNEAAKLTYQIDAASSIDDLPFDIATRSRLRETVLAAARQGIANALLPCYHGDGDTTVVLYLSAVDSRLEVSTTDFVWPDNLVGLLREAFELTAAEAAVALLLVHGRSSRQIADRRSTAVQTVRTQVRSIYAKSGVHSVAELTRLMFGVANFIRDSGPNGVFPTHRDRLAGEEERPAPIPGQRHTLALPDGRTVGYADFGLSAGLPVLFCHDEHCGDTWTQTAVEHACTTGLRLIAVARPCYGTSSDLAQGVNERRMEAAADCLRVLDALGIDTFVCLTRGMGAAIGICLSTLAPTRLLGIVSVAPALPVRDADFKRINPVARLMIHSLFHNKALARFLMSVQMRFVRRHGPKRFFTQRYPTPSADRDIIQDPATMAVIEAGVSFCMTQGYKGFLGDVFDAGMGYERCANMLRHPTMILLGEEDTHGRRERAQYLAALASQVQVEIVAGAGDLLFYREHERYLELVRNMHDVYG
ncbi:MAG: alpha/beta hydrolase [Pseudomonadota bacterium]